MSTDLIALFDVVPGHGSPEHLRARLLEAPHFADEIIALYREHWLPQAWEIENPPRAGCPVLYGPGGFALRFKPGVLELYHMMPFSLFAGDVVLRQNMRRACRTLADAVGSDHVIFTHEMMPVEGNDLAAIECALAEHIGPPAATYRELNEAEYFGPHAWLVDALSDVGAP